MLESNNPISMSELQAMIGDLDRAWFEFDSQHDRLCVISGRGWLLGLQAYHADLMHCGAVEMMDHESERDVCLTHPQWLRIQLTTIQIGTT